ncbi:hypothetical protein [Pseudomonas sp. AFG_SD02_1510_Pfu_092]|uniref:hypothetical protein n=1 Tax=Pseudomonas sp. AFG_SD02_1510_Pfu_092 TaxID=2259497 RepID=UPI001379DFA2|nr:hypothetical protein [Pseudomonas sp. AFG_SD02_1510_Pfu_092]
MTLPPVARAMRQIEGKDFKKKTPGIAAIILKRHFLYVNSDYPAIVNRRTEPRLK